MLIVDYFGGGIWQLSGIPSLTVWAEYFGKLMSRNKKDSLKRYRTSSGVTQRVRGHVVVVQATTIWGRVDRISIAVYWFWVDAQAGHIKSRLRGLELEKYDRDFGTKLSVGFRALGGCERTHIILCKGAQRWALSRSQCWFALYFGACTQRMLYYILCFILL